MTSTPEWAPSAMGRIVLRNLPLAFQLATLRPGRAHIKASGLPRS
jgi:hypothetical protein